jgi:formate dehydrogenase subunit gamma
MFNINKEFENLKNKKNGLIPLLHSIQNQYGYIPIEFVEILAKRLNLSKAEIWGVITFYSDFKTKKPGKNIIKVCRSESCIANGGLEIQKYLKSKLNINFKETTEDGKFTLEEVFCFGNCGCGPSVMINNKLYGKVSLKKLEELLKNLSGDENGQDI